MFPTSAATPEILLTIYVMAVIAFTAYTIKSLGLLHESPEHLERIKNWVETVRSIIGGTPCPLCGGKLEVEQASYPDLIRVRCNGCGRVSLWQMRRRRWVMVAPLTPTPPPPQPPTLEVEEAEADG